MRFDLVYIFEELLNSSHLGITHGGRLKFNLL